MIIVIIVVLKFITERNYYNIWSGMPRLNRDTEQFLKNVEKRFGTSSLTPVRYGLKKTTCVDLPKETLQTIDVPFDQLQNVINKIKLDPPMWDYLKQCGYLSNAIFLLIIIPGLQTKETITFDDKKRFQTLIDNAKLAVAEL